MKLAYLADCGNPWLSKGAGVLGKALAIGGLPRDALQPLATSVGHEAIIALGPRSAAQLTGRSIHPGNIDRMRGYRFDTLAYGPVIPTFDPVFVREGKMGLMHALIYDLKIAPTKPSPKIPHDDLIIDPSPLKFTAFVDDWLPKAEWLVCDIETPYSEGKPEDDALLDDPSSTLIRISIAFIFPNGTIKSITIPYNDAYKPTLQEFLSSGKPVIFWNGDYDVPRLEVNECPLKGQLIDAMWLFHFLYPDLPRSLASGASFYTPLPEWKSLSTSEPELYSALDSWATAKTFLGIRKNLMEKGMWEAAWDHVVKLQQVLRKMRSRGLLVDVQKLEQFRTYLGGELFDLQTKLNSLVPLSVRPKSTILAKHLRGRCGCLRPVLGKKGLPLKKLVADSMCTLCGGSGWNAPIVEVLDFNPSSPEQVKDLIRALGHKVPTVKDEKGDDKETTDQRFINFLAGQYPKAPYKHIASYRKIAKVKNTYTEWPLRDCAWEGCRIASTKLGLDPATGRLSSQNPNMQNIPKEGELADAFKKCIVARPGHRISKTDYSGIEAVLTGYFSNDAEYMRLSLLGIHTYRCAQWFKEAPDLALPDKELAAALKKLKKKYDITNPGETCSIYQRFKKINHMGNYGARPKKIFESSPGVFNDQDEARKLWVFLKKQQPKRQIWWDKVRARINSKEHRIVNPYMYNRWFFDDSELTKAIATEPQGTAAAIIKEAMLLIDETIAGPFMILQVHDELVFDFPIAPGSCKCCPDNTLTFADYQKIVIDIMERPLPKLGGLVIKTDTSSGDNYACK